MHYPLFLLLNKRTARYRLGASHYHLLMLALIGMLALLLPGKPAHAAESISSIQLETRIMTNPTNTNVKGLRSYFFKLGEHYVDAARGRYAPNGLHIIFDAKHDGGFFDVFELDNTDEKITSITDGDPRFPRHAGNAVYDPTGRWIIFIAEEPQHYLADNPYFSDLGQPGIGLYNNLWSYDRVTKNFFKLTNIPIKTWIGDPTPNYATVNPKLSADGSHIMWTELYENGPFAGHWGKWRVKIAEFNGNSLSNTRIVLDSEIRCKLRKLFTPNVCEDPSLFGNYVTGMGFHPLNRDVILVAGNMDAQHVYGIDLYVYNVRDKALFKVTRDADDWTEGSTWTHDGQGIITMSFRPFLLPPLDTSDPNWVAQETWREYWSMTPVGTQRSRLTYFRCLVCSDQQVLPWPGNLTIVGAIASAKHDPKRFLGLVSNNDNSGRRVLGLLELSMN